MVNLKRISYVFLLCVFLFSSFAFADDPVDDLGYPSDTVGSSTEVLRISANDTTGLHSILLRLLGDYNPIAVTTEYRYPSGTGYQTRYQVDVEPDWSWIMTSALFIIVVYCTFKFIGGIFSK